jgi:NADPH2:quinone reductase
MRRLPLTAGIDLAGIVVSSADERYRAGDPVIVVGCGLGEEHDGGYAEFSIVRGDWIVPLPPSLTLREAMAIGTAGFTAALAIDRMEVNGQRPEHGAVVVTGATGGVGNLAILLLARRGYRVVALTGKPDATPYLERLGATDILAASEVPSVARPLETARWAGAIDNVGGEVLAWLCATTRPLGNVASVGLAGSHSLITTVMPFILRGVNLLGVNSTHCPADRRDRAWARLAADLSGGALEMVVRRTVDLADLPGAFEAYTARQVVGRTLVRISGALR